MKKVIILLFAIILYSNHGIAQVRKGNKIDVESYKLRGELFIRNNEKDSAFALINDMSSRCKETCDYQYMIDYLYGYFYDYSNDLTKAEKYYTKSLTAKENNADALDRRGLIYYSLEKFVQSESDYRKSMLYDKKNAVPAYMLSLIYSTSLYRKNLDTASFYIDKALIRDSLNIDFLNQKVAILMAQQKCVEAEKYESRILELLRNGDPTETDMLQVVDILICVKKEEAAIGLLLQLNSALESETVWMKLAYLYSLKKDWKSSMIWLEKITDKNSTNIDAMVDLVSIKYQEGEREEAKKKLDQFITTTNGNIRLYELKSDIYRAEGDFKTALVYINKTVAQSDHLHFLNKKARLESESQDYAAAIVDYNKILKVDSCNLEVLDFCSKYDFKKTNFKNSIRLVKKSQQCGFEIELIDVLVQSYFYDGQYDLVRKNIDKWWVNDKEDEACIFIKAVMEACYGDKDKAIVLSKMLKKNISLANAQANNLLLSLLYLSSGDMKSFYTEMSQIVSLDKNVFEKFVFFEKKKSKGDADKIKITKKENFDFLLTIEISEEQLNEIKLRYGF